MNIGAGLKELRTKAGLSQSELAKRVRVTQAYLSGIESGSKPASPDVLGKIAGALGMPLPLLLWFLIDEEDVPQRKRAVFATIKPAIDKLLEQFI